MELFERATKDGEELNGGEGGIRTALKRLSFYSASWLPYKLPYTRKTPPNKLADPCLPTNVFRYCNRFAARALDDEAGS